MQQLPVNHHWRHPELLRGIWRVPSTRPNKLPRKIPVKRDLDARKKLGIFEFATEKKMDSCSRPDDA